MGIKGRGDEEDDRGREREGLPKRRRPHRVKWKPVYARLSSRVNPDHSSIVPQTGDPRPFQPFRPPIPPSPFSHPFPPRPGKPVSSNQKERTFRARLKSMAFRESVPLDYRDQRMTRGIFSHGRKWTQKKNKKNRENSYRSSSYIPRDFDHFSNSSETGTMSLPRLFLSCSPSTISSPLKLNSRSIRPQGRFCSSGNEINVSFKRSRSPVIGGRTR